MNRLTKVLPHVSIVLAGLMIVLYIADYFNGEMGFLENDGAKILLLVLSLVSIVTAIVLVAYQRREQMEHRP